MELIGDDIKEFIVFMGDLENETEKNFKEDSL
jgi:hypothetical protein